MTAQSKWQKSEQIKAWPNWLIRKLLVWDFHTRIWICNTGLLEGCGWAKESSTAPTCSAWVVSGVSAQEVEGKKLKLLGLRDPQHPTVSLRIWRNPNIRQWAWESEGSPQHLAVSLRIWRTPPPQHPAVSLRITGSRSLGNLCPKLWKIQHRIDRTLGELARQKWEVSNYKGKEWEGGGITIAFREVKKILTEILGTVAYLQSGYAYKPNKFLEI